MVAGPRRSQDKAKAKALLCSDWLPEEAKWALTALFHKQKSFA